MRKLIYLLLLFPTLGFANHQVFGIRTDFPMTDDQPHYRDVYVSIGTDQGIKVGSQLDAFRVLTTVDELNQRMGKNISFRIARLRVIHAEGDVSVARVVQMLPAESTPIGTHTNVMVGDRVEVARR
jgi:hypothetical protein